MHAPTLVVSDPPHDGVDLEAAAALVELDVFQSRLKFNFPAPEVLDASDGSFSTAIAESYARSGVCVSEIDGRHLLDVPWPDPVAAFDFTGAGLILATSRGDVLLPYDQPLVGVVCRPPADPYPKRHEASIDISGEGLAVAEAVERQAIFDLYVDRDGQTHRMSIVRGFTDFSGLKAARRRTGDEDMSETVAGVSRRFRQLRLDDRLDGIRPRRRFVIGDAAHNPDTRLRYSFGTLLLRGILTSIAPELGELTQYELGSRLGYLTTRARHGVKYHA